jgi:hypothetical protein
MAGGRWPLRLPTGKAVPLSQLLSLIVYVLSHCQSTPCTPSLVLSHLFSPPLSSPRMWSGISTIVFLLASVTRLALGAPSEDVLVDNEGVYTLQYSGNWTVNRTDNSSYSYTITHGDSFELRFNGGRGVVFNQCRVLLITYRHICPVLWA